LSNSVLTWPAERCHDGERRRDSASVVRETPLTIRLNGRELVTLLTDGTQPEELALGFLHNEGLLDRLDQVRSAVFDPRAQEAAVEAAVDDALLTAVHGKRLIASGCGKGSLFYHVLDSIKAGRLRLDSDLRLPLDFIYEQATLLARRSTTYAQSRGVHGAALLNAGGVACFREDIGRHNALDKLAGWLLRADRGAGDMALYTTGRPTSEVALKAARMGTPIVLSRSMPTELALRLAEQTGLTVVGALRGRQCLIFTRPERVV
jgi:FdhD protein